MYPLKDKRIYSQNILIFALLTVGILIRLFHYFYNRSLWMDEVYLSTSIVKMNISELVSKPLYYQQKAPLGFLIIVKLIINILGNKEMPLRLFPLVSGIASMFLFVPICKHFLKDYASLLAIGIICLAPAIIYHSVEIKQYSTELLGTMLSIYFYIRLKDRTDFKNLIIWGLTGALTLWFSYSSIFILGGIAIGLSLIYLKQKKWHTFFLSIIPFSMWLISFAVNYLLFTHKHAESEWIAYWFRAYDNFMPLPPKSVADLKWFAINIYRMLDYPLGLLWNFNGIASNQAVNMALKMPFLPVLFLITGFYTAIKRNRTDLIVLIFPVLLMFLASGLELYPLTERFWLFIAPVFILFISKGYNLIISFCKAKWLRILLLILILTGPLVQAIQSFINPKEFYVHKKSFQREALAYLNEKYRNGDTVYVYWNDLPGFKLYTEMYNYNFKAIEGTDQRKNSTSYSSYFNNLKSDFDKFLNSKRFWVVVNSQFLTDIGDRIDEPKWYYQDKNPIKNLIKELKKKNIIIEEYQTKDIKTYLFIPK